jgi:hypothetical protein
VLHQQNAVRIVQLPDPKSLVRLRFVGSDNILVMASDTATIHYRNGIAVTTAFEGHSLPPLQHPQRLRVGLHHSHSALVHLIDALREHFRMNAVDLPALFHALGLVLRASAAGTSEKSDSDCCNSSSLHCTLRLSFQALPYSRLYSLASSSAVHVSKSDISTRAVNSVAR